MERKGEGLHLSHLKSHAGWTPATRESFGEPGVLCDEGLAGISLLSGVWWAAERGACWCHQLVLWEGSWQTEPAYFPEIKGICEQRELCLLLPWWVLKAAGEFSWATLGSVTLFLNLKVGAHKLNGCWFFCPLFRHICHRTCTRD